MIKAREKGLYLDMSQDWIDQMGEYHPKTQCVTRYEMCRLLIAAIKTAFFDATGLIACRADALKHSASTLAGVAYAEGSQLLEWFASTLDLCVY
jgi:hypothetical protein